MAQSTRAADVQIEARPIHDSRGRPTVQARLRLGNVEGVGDVPAGASTGGDEARTVTTDQALANIEKVIAPLFKQSQADLTDHAQLVKLEREIVARAGTNFVDLGANAVVPVSRALWQLGAHLHDMPLHAYIRQNEPELAPKGAGRVNFFMNIFNGGLHALRDGEKLGRDRIDIQEIMVVPVSATTYAQALEMGEKIDAALEAVLRESFAPDSITRADEAGFSVKGLGDSGQAIAYVFDAIGRAGYTPGKDVKLAIDAAATSFYDKKAGHYDFQGEALGTDAMIDTLLQLIDRYPGKVIALEDGLDENDWEGWPKLSAALKERNIVSVGDDVYVTQLPRLQKGIDTRASDAILIKVNQNGSMSGTFDVMKTARAHNMRCVISHRSGETLDDSIADLAYATGAMGLKTGDPQPTRAFPDESTWVRRRKYLRMVAIEQGA